MHRSPSTTAKTAALWLLLGTAPITQVVRAAPLDARGTVASLEGALVKATGKERAAVLAKLRDAYPAAIRQAEAEGKKAEAEGYRDDLEIVARKAAVPARPSPAPAPAVEPAPAPSVPKSDPPAAKSPTPEPATGLDVEPMRPLAEPAPIPIDPPPAEKAPAPAASTPAPGSIVTLPSEGTNPPKSEGLADEAVEPARNPDQAPIEPGPVSPMPTPTPSSPPAEPASAPQGPSVEAADAAFTAKHYEEAGRIYAALEKAGNLPATRRDHWAYCRSVEVVRRINARPASTQEWAEIDAEIQGIQKLSPKNWFAEYLRNRAAERNRGAAVKPKGLSSNAMILRGSSPDEPPAPAPSRAPVPTTESVPFETANFRVIGCDRVTAERLARSAEAARDAQIARWSGSAHPAATWSPRCEIHVYPNGEALARETGQRPESPGFSTMNLNEGKVVGRRINLRADHPTALKAVLPHEVTHVVLADIFPTRQIPRWADEGMAVLAEPPSEQVLRASDLEKPLASGKVFRPADLFAMDYPGGETWPLYYAQSVSVTRFLVEAGTPAQFIKFVRETQKTGPEQALRTVYEISGYDELQDQWLTYARSRAAATLTASSETNEKAAATESR